MTPQKPQKDYLVKSTKLQLNAKLKKQKKNVSPFKSTLNSNIDATKSSWRHWNTMMTLSLDDCTVNPPNQVCILLRLLSWLSLMLLWQSHHGWLNRPQSKHEAAQTKKTQASARSFSQGQSWPSSLTCKACLEFIFGAKGMCTVGILMNAGQKTANPIVQSAQQCLPAHRQNQGHSPGIHNLPQRETPHKKNQTAPCSAVKHYIFTVSNWEPCYIYAIHPVDFHNGKNRWNRGVQ